MTQQTDPEVSLRLAVRMMWLIGGLLLTPGAVLAVFFIREVFETGLARLRADFLFAVLLWCAPAIPFLLCAWFIQLRRAWAVRLGIGVAGLLLIVLVLGSCLVGRLAVGGPGLPGLEVLILGIVLGGGAACATAIKQLLIVLDSPLLTHRKTRGFEPIMPVPDAPPDRPPDLGDPSENAANNRSAEADPTRAHGSDSP